MEEINDANGISFNNLNDISLIEEELKIFDYKDESCDYDNIINDKDENNNDRDKSNDSFDNIFPITKSKPSNIIASAIKLNSKSSKESVLIDDVVIPMRRSIGEKSGHDNIYSSFEGNDDQFLSIAAPIIEDETLSFDDDAKVKRNSLVSSTKKYIYKTFFGVEKVEMMEDDDDLNIMEFVKSRTTLPYIIKCHPEIHSFFLAVINLKQPKIGPCKSSPQGTRLESMPIMASSNYDICKSAAETLSPPLWSGDTDEQVCIICKYSFAILRKGHHCRNCGYLVCHNCSSKSWPSEMLPSTYHYHEKFVRICDCCNFLHEAFSDSLRYGDYEIARAIFETGNINLNSPYAIYVTRDYPIHCAAEGGNIKLFKWLVEEKHCPLYHEYKSTEETSLLNAYGESCFAIACKFGNIDIMKYLTQEKGCLVQEITDINIALRGLHRLLDSHGEIPLCNNVRNDHFNCERNITDSKSKSSSYAVAIDPSRSCFKNLPSARAARAESKKSIEEYMLSRTDRRPPLNIRSIRRPISNRAFKQCLNTINNNLNLFMN